MTNGEMIQSIFPNMNFGTLAQDDVIVNRDYSNNNEPQVFIPKRVWNAEYKEPTTKNNLGVDCVSRQAVLKIYDEWFATCNIADKKESPKAKIKALSSVTPIRPKGHWIDRWDKVLLCEDKNCSVCGYLAQTKYNYCPKCGAEMESEER